MPKKALAVALCRVSSYEQLLNNSLGHQKDNVLKAAKKLNVDIPEDAVWEGAISSKKGVNYNRKDLLQIYDYCKKNRNVEYLIVQEVDRFMRSPEEQTYWYVKFWYELKVRVWYADKPELNEDTHNASLFRFLEGWRAGGSNEERKSKSIGGQLASLKEGKYPFNIKPGYIKGQRSGIQEIDPIKGPALKAALLSIYNKEVTPTQALKDLNKSAFMHDGHALYKMDKFSKIATDPFYAGVVCINKQIQFRNENGLHQPLITLQQHNEIVKIFNAKGKTQTGPRKNGNPEFPLSNLVSCSMCTQKRNGRYVGFNHSNGKNDSLVYQKYRCRSCGKYIKRDELHDKVEHYLKKYQLSPESSSAFIKALAAVWKREEAQTEQEVRRLERQIKDLKTKIKSQAAAAIEPSNAYIREDILANITDNKKAATELEEKISNLLSTKNNDWEKFLEFALSFANSMGSHFLEISQEDRLRCKQILFPAGFRLDENGKVYTPEISPIYRLATTKKDLPETEKSFMVRVGGL